MSDSSIYTDLEPPISTRLNDLSTNVHVMVASRLRFLLSPSVTLEYFDSSMNTVTNINHKHIVNMIKCELHWLLSWCRQLIRVLNVVDVGVVGIVSAVSLVGIVSVVSPVTVLGGVTVVV